MRMSRHVRGSLIALSLALGLTVASAAVAAPKDDPVVVKVSQSANDLHSVFMALKLATATAQRGHPTTLFVNLEAVRLFLKSQPGNLRWGTMDTTFSDLLTSFKKAGGQVLVCPHCAKAAGIEANQLAHGAKLASETEVAELFSSAGKVIDY